MSNTSVIPTNDFEKIILERRSIKSYNPDVIISREEMEDMLKKATRAPSSTNMQPWHFLIIQSAESKAKLLEVASPTNHVKLETASAAIAIFGDLHYTTRAEEIYSTNVELGYVTEEIKERQLAAVLQWNSPKTEEQRRDIVMTDCGLVAMQLMLVARSHGYDTNPINGYDKTRINEAFGLDKKRYAPVMLLALGKAADEGFPTMRLSPDKIAQWL